MSPSFPRKSSQIFFICSVQRGVTKCDFISTGILSYLHEACVVLDAIVNMIFSFDAGVFTIFNGFLFVSYITSYSCQFRILRVIFYLLTTIHILCLFIELLLLLFTKFTPVNFCQLNVEGVSPSEAGITAGIVKVPVHSSHPF